MYFSDEVELGTIQCAPTAEGYPGESTFVPVRTVYADLRSVRRDEFYKAAAAGLAVAAIFAVHMEDYGGETTVRWNGKLYSVVRSYQAGCSVELTCKDSGVQDENGSSVPQ